MKVNRPFHSHPPEDNISFNQKGDLSHIATSQQYLKKSTEQYRVYKIDIKEQTPRNAAFSEKLDHQIFLKQFISPFESILSQNELSSLKNLLNEIFSNLSTQLLKRLVGTSAVIASFFKQSNAAKKELFELITELSLIKNNASLKKEKSEIIRNKIRSIQNESMHWIANPQDRQEINDFLFFITSRVFSQFN